MSVVEELSGDGSRIVTSWKRTTVADGDWLQHNTISPLNERDVFLAEKIDELSGNSDEKLNEEIAARIAGDEQLYDELSTVSSDFYSFSADVETSAYTLSAAITAEADVRKRVDEDLLGKIEQLQNATDVVDVVGTHEELLAYNEPLTKNDVVKVLVDETKNYLEYYWRVVGDEPQKPYQWTEVGTITPYYSKSEIDEKFDDLSYVSSISADETEIGFDFHKGDGTLTTFKLKEGPNITFTPGTNDLTISALPGTKSYYIDDSKNPNNMFWGESNYNPAFEFLAGENHDWSTMNEIIDSFNNNIPVYINEFNEASEVDSSNYSWKLNTIKTFTADDRPHIKFTFENEHEETNFYGVIDWKDGDHGIVVESYSGISKSTLLHDTNLSGDGSPTNALGLNSAINLYIPKKQAVNSAYIQIGATPRLQSMGGYNEGVAIVRNEKFETKHAGEQTANLGVSIGVPGITITHSANGVGGYAMYSVYGETFNLNYSLGDSYLKHLWVDENGLNYTNNANLSYSASYNAFNLKFWDTQHTVPGGTDGYSAQYVNASSIYRWNHLLDTKISAQGNGITNTATFDLSSFNLSAGAGLKFISANGRLDISAEGTTYNAGTYISTANKTISVTGNLIGSAESGQSAYDWITTKSATLQAGPGIGFYSAGPNKLGISAEGTKVSAGGNINNPTEYTTNVNLSAGGGVQFVTADNNVLGIKTTTMEYCPFNYSTYSDMTSFKISAVGIQGTLYESVVRVNDNVYGFLLPDPSPSDHLKIPVARYDGRGYYYLDTVTGAIGNYVSAFDKQKITLATAASLPSTLDENVYYII
jgi:hypothetical protein